MDVTALNPADFIIGTDAGQAFVNQLSPTIFTIDFGNNTSSGVPWSLIGNGGTVPPLAFPAPA